MIGFKQIEFLTIRDEAHSRDGHNPPKGSIPYGRRFKDLLRSAVKREYAPRASWRVARRIDYRFSPAVQLVIIVIGDARLSSVAALTKNRCPSAVTA